MNQNTYKYLGAAAGLGILYFGYKRYFSNKDFVRHDVYHHNKKYSILYNTSSDVKTPTGTHTIDTGSFY